MLIKFPKDCIITPNELLNYYTEYNDVVALANNMGFKVTLNMISNQDVKCIIITESDNKNVIKQIVINQLQSGEWKRFEVAYLIALYILRGNDVKFGAKVRYSDFFKEENLEVIDYASELLLSDSLIRKRLPYVDNRYEFEKLKSEIVVPEFILRRKIEKIKEEIK